MSFDQKIQIALTVLLTGLVIVFVMLIFLTFIMKGYGAHISTIQTKIEDKKDVQAAPAPVVQVGISAEVVAAISAAVYIMYGNSAGTVTSIRRAVHSNRSAWGMAGLLENTRPF